MRISTALLLTEGVAGMALEAMLDGEIFWMAHAAPPIHAGQRQLCTQRAFKEAEPSEGLASTFGMKQQSAILSGWLVGWLAD